MPLIPIIYFTIIITVDESMDEDRLNSLAILSIESEITISLKYEDVIKEFALQKAHRKM